MMKRSVLIMAVAMCAAGLVVAGGIRETPRYVEKQHKKALAGKSPEDLAKFFAHPSYHVSAAAQQLMAEHGDEAIPLLKKMLTSDHPASRNCATKTLGMICKQKMAADGEEKSAGTQELMTLLKDLATGEDLFVSTPAVGLLTVVSGDEGKFTPEYEAVLLKMAVSENDVERSAVIGKVFRKKNIPVETSIKVATLVLGGGAGPGNHGWQINNDWLLGRRMDDYPELVKLAVPNAGKFLMNVANSAPPLRGMFTPNAHSAPVLIIARFITPEIEKEHPLVVQGVCRSYVRCAYRGKFSDEPCKKVFEKLTHASFSSVRQLAKMEEAVLNSDDEDMKDSLEANKREKEWRAAIAELYELADKLSMMQAEGGGSDQ
jgi:hypothetical protein